MLPCWGRAYINPQMPGSARVLFDAAQARAYGRFLGQRYGKEPHIVWVLGGDANATAGKAGEQFTIYRAMAEGIGQGATGRGLRWNRKDAGWDEMMMTYHPDGDPAYNSSNWFHGDAWLDFNGIETWKSIGKVYETVARDYSLEAPTKPTMLLKAPMRRASTPVPATASRPTNRVSMPIIHSSPAAPGTRTADSRCGILRAIPRTIPISTPGATL